jgi:hypothetical protein
VATLWTSDALEDWQRALESYEDVISQQRVERLPDLDCLRSSSITVVSEFVEHRDLER